MSDFLSREEFLKTAQPKVEKVWIESLQNYVYLKEISGDDQDSYDLAMVEFVDQPDGGSKARAKLDNARSKYIVRALSDHNGQRLFRDNEYHLIGAKSTAVLKELHDAAKRVNGVTEEDEKEMEKNLEVEQTGGSNSD